MNGIIDAMATAQSIEHIEVTDQMGGHPKLKGRRITVAMIKVWHLEQDRSVEDIAEGHDISPAQVHAALAYYFDHQDQIERQIREEDDGLRQFMKDHPSGSRLPPHG